MKTQLNVGKFSFFPFFRKDDALNIQIAVINLHLRQHKWPLLESCIMPPFPMSFLLQDIKRICALHSSSSSPSSGSDVSCESSPVTEGSGAKLESIHSICSPECQVCGEFCQSWSDNKLVIHTSYIKFPAIVRLCSLFSFRGHCSRLAFLDHLITVAVLQCMQLPIQRACPLCAFSLALAKFLGFLEMLTHLEIIIR